MSRYQKARQKHGIQVVNMSFEDAAKLKYSEFLSSCLLYRNVKVNIYKTVILPVVLYGCGT
jgi:hypothetical protein